MLNWLTKTRQRRLALVVVGAFFLLGLVSLFEPIYGQICHYNEYKDAEKCSPDRLVIALLDNLWSFVNAGSVFIAAIATGVIAWFTFSLRDATRQQAKLAERSGEHFRVTERAYMQLSHEGELVITPPDAIGITMQIRNWGKTPGSVTDHTLAFQALGTALELDPVPDYGTHERGTGAFLVPTGKFSFGINFRVEPMVLDAMTINRAPRLYLFGYVDYRDQFGGRFRSGYARVFLPERTGTGNNLGFAGGTTYNYDRARVSGEGWDWEE